MPMMSAASLTSGTHNSYDRASPRVKSKSMFRSLEWHPLVRSSNQPCGSGCYGPPAMASLPLLPSSEIKCVSDHTVTFQTSLGVVHSGAFPLWPLCLYFEITCVSYRAVTFQTSLGVVRSGALVIGQGG
jgi:hypothetical protein